MKWYFYGIGALTAVFIKPFLYKTLEHLLEKSEKHCILYFHAKASDLYKYIVASLNFSINVLFVLFLGMTSLEFLGYEKTTIILFAIAISYYAAASKQR